MGTSGGGDSNRRQEYDGGGELTKICHGLSGGGTFTNFPCYYMIVGPEIPAHRWVLQAVGAQAAWTFSLVSGLHREAEDYSLWGWEYEKCRWRLKSDGSLFQCTWERRMQKVIRSGQFFG